MIPPLNSNLISLICSYIRSGAYAQTAAGAAGVPGELFRKWLMRGRRHSDREPYGTLVYEVVKAEAQCRILAEVAVRRETPLQWLKSGPGKERPRRPGWTTTAPPSTMGNPIKETSWSNLGSEVIQQLMIGLDAFPEARQAAAAILFHSQRQNRSRRPVE